MGVYKMCVRSVCVAVCSSCVIILTQTTHVSVLVYNIRATIFSTEVPFNREWKVYWTLLI